MKFFAIISTIFVVLSCTVKNAPEVAKPSLDQNSHHISLSHSYPYVAAQIDSHAVGIDVEQPKEKLLRIAHRVFNKAEVKDAGTDLAHVSAASGRREHCQRIQARLWSGRILSGKVLWHGSRHAGARAVL